MSRRNFLILLTVVTAVCLALTLAHLIYAVYAYGHCSIIEFIAREQWS